MATLPSYIQRALQKAAPTGGYPYQYRGTEVKTYPPDPRFKTTTPVFTEKGIVNVPLPTGTGTPTGDGGGGSGGGSSGTTDKYGNPTRPTGGGTTGTSLPPEVPTPESEAGHGIATITAQVPDYSADEAQLEALRQQTLAEQRQNAEAQKQYQKQLETLRNPNLLRKSGLGYMLAPAGKEARYSALGNVQTVQKQIVARQGELKQFVTETIEPALQRIAQAKEAARAYQKDVESYNQAATLWNNGTAPSVDDDPQVIYYFKLFSLGQTTYTAPVEFVNPITGEGFSYPPGSEVPPELVPIPLPSMPSSGIDIYKILGAAPPTAFTGSGAEQLYKALGVTYTGVSALPSVTATPTVTPTQLSLFPTTIAQPVTQFATDIFSRAWTPIESAYTQTFTPEFRAAIPQIPSKIKKVITEKKEFFPKKQEFAYVLTIPEDLKPLTPEEIEARGGYYVAQPTTPLPKPGKPFYTYLGMAGTEEQQKAQATVLGIAGAGIGFGLPLAGGMLATLGGWTTAAISSTALIPAQEKTAEFGDKLIKDYDAQVSGNVIKFGAEMIPTSPIDIGKYYLGYKIYTALPSPERYATDILFTGIGGAKFVTGQTPEEKAYGFVTAAPGLFGFGIEGYPIVRGQLAKLSPAYRGVRQVAEENIEFIPFESQEGVAFAFEKAATLKSVAGEEPFLVVGKEQKRLIAIEPGKKARPFNKMLINKIKKDEPVILSDTPSIPKVTGLYKSAINVAKEEGATAAGSFALKVQLKESRSFGDIDIVATNPQTVAEILSRRTGIKPEARTISTDAGEFVIYAFERNGQKVEIVPSAAYSDVYPLARFADLPRRNVEGLNVLDVRTILKTKFSAIKKPAKYEKSILDISAISGYPVEAFKRPPITAYGYSLKEQAELEAGKIMDITSSSIGFFDSKLAREIDVSKIVSKELKPGQRPLESAFFFTPATAGGEPQFRVSRLFLKEGERGQPVFRREKPQILIEENKFIENIPEELTPLFNKAVKGDKKAYAEFFKRYEEYQLNNPGKVFPLGFPTSELEVTASLGTIIERVGETPRTRLLKKIGIQRGETISAIVPPGKTLPRRADIFFIKTRAPKTATEIEEVAKLQEISRLKQQGLIGTDADLISQDLGLVGMGGKKQMTTAEVREFLAKMSKKYGVDYFQATGLTSVTPSLGRGEVRIIKPFILPPVRRAAEVRTGRIISDVRINRLIRDTDIPRIPRGMGRISEPLRPTRTTVETRMPEIVRIPREPQIPRVPREPEIPRIPGMPMRPSMIKRERETRKKRQRISPAYSVFLKRQGRFVPVRTGLPRGRALMFGAEQVSKELSRQFKVVQSGTTELEDVAFRPSGMFRPYKVRRGKQIALEPGRFIQKTRFALSSPQEKRLIQQAKRKVNLLKGIPA